MKNSLSRLYLVSNRYKDKVNGWSGGGVRGGVVTSGGPLWCGHLYGCVPGRRNKERRLKRVELKSTPLRSWMVKNRLGWQGSRKSLAHLQGFLLFFSVRAGGLLPCKLFWIFTLYRVGVSFLQRPRKRQGGEGSLALNPTRMRFWMYDSFT